MASLAHELNELVMVLNASTEQRLAPFDLTYRRFVALVIIGEHPGLTGRRLAEALGVSEAAVSGLLRSLFDRGLVTDDAPAGSGHRRSLRLTPAGTRLWRRSAAALGDAFDRFVSSLGIDADGLTDTIRTIRVALAEDARPTGHSTPEGS